MLNTGARPGPAQQIRIKLNLSPYSFDPASSSKNCAQGQHPPHPVYRCSIEGFPFDNFERSNGLLITFGDGKLVHNARFSTGGFVIAVKLCGWIKFKNLLVH